MDLRARTSNATPLSSAEQKILDIITSLTLKSSSRERNVRLGKATISVKCVTFCCARSVFYLSPLLSLFSAVIQSQRPHLANFPDIYETRLGVIFAIHAKHTSKSHYARHSKQASVLEQKNIAGKEFHCIRCPHLAWCFICRQSHSKACRAWVHAYCG